MADDLETDPKKVISILLSRGYLKDLSTPDASMVQYLQSEGYLGKRAPRAMFDDKAIEKGKAKSDIYAFLAGDCLALNNRLDDKFSASGPNLFKTEKGVISVFQEIVDEMQGEGCFLEGLDAYHDQRNEMADDPEAEAVCAGRIALYVWVARMRSAGHDVG